MKKSTLISTISMAFLMLISVNVNAQEFADLDKSPMDAASYPTSYKESKKQIKIIYSRPQLKERSLEKLAPNDEVWRTGANEAAELTLYTPMVFGDTKVDSGTYTFYVIPGEKEWTAIISKDLNVWGSYFYNEKNDVARVTVPVVIAKESMEVFSIAFSEADKGIKMHLAWDDVRITIPFVKK